MLEKLVKIVTERLANWETTRSNISQKEIFTLDEKFFLKGKIVRIKEVNQDFLNRLGSGNADEKQNWLNLAKSYGVEIELELFDTGEPWLRYEQIVKIPYPIFSLTGDRLEHVPRNIICYQDVALLAPGSHLCKYEWQLMTALASESLSKQNITVRERE